MGRRTLLLITSILVAAVGTALIGLYVKGADTRATDKHTLSSVLVATSMIAIGTKPDNTNTAVQEWPADTLPTGYFADLSGLTGQTATTTIYPQTPIQKGMFGTNVAVAGGLGSGQLGLTVELADPDRAAGLLQVGSKIEIFSISTNSGGKKVTNPVLGAGGAASGVQVIAIGGDRLGSGTGSATNTSSAEGNGSSSNSSSSSAVPSTIVGLALTPSEITKVKGAEANGSLYFAVYGGPQGSS